MKSYTDIEQSKKLAEILPLESADMFYRDDTGIDVKLMWEHNAQKLSYPCWSLAALFEVIPKYIEDHYVLRMDYNKDFSIWYDDIGYGVDIELPVITKDSAIDACYKMIIRLHELNLL